MSKAQPIFDMSKAQAIGGTAATPTDEPGTYGKLTRGYNPDVEQWAEKHPVIGPIARFLDSAGAAAISTPETVGTFLKQFGNHLLTGEPIQGVEDAAANLKEYATNPNVRKAIPHLLPEALGAGTGSVAGGEMLGSATGAVTKVGLNKAGNALGNLQTKVAQLVRDPATGKIKSPYEIAVEKALPDPYAPTSIPAESIPKGTNFGQWLEQQKAATKQAAKEGQAVPIKNSPNFNPEAYKAGQTGEGPSTPISQSPNYLKFQEAKQAFIDAQKARAGKGSIIDPNNIPADEVTHVSVPWDELKKMAMGGDKYAIDEVIRRGRQAEIPGLASAIGKAKPYPKIGRQ